MVIPTSGKRQKQENERAFARSVPKILLGVGVCLLLFTVQMAGRIAFSDEAVTPSAGSLRTAPKQQHELGHHGVHTVAELTEKLRKKRKVKQQSDGHVGDGDSEGHGHGIMHKLQHRHNKHDSKTKKKEVAHEERDVVASVKGNVGKKRLHSHGGLDPEKWEQFSYHDLRKYFGCNKLFEKPRPIITDDEWRYFRDLYNQHLAADLAAGNPPDTYKLGKEPYDCPVEGSITADKGRGLVASRDISKGELIFTASNNTIVFQTGHAWRKLLWHLYHAPPPDDVYTAGFACDIHAWSWNQEVPKDGPTAIVVDIDKSSLLNQPSEGELHNIKCGKNDETECVMDYYSTTDIQKGDEILCDYSDFSSPDWHGMGL